MRSFIQSLSLTVIVTNLLPFTLPIHAQFAAEVLSYEPGADIATQFGTGLAYDLTQSVIGEPSRITPGQFGGPVDPFSPPYLREQLLSIGTGGHVTVRLDSPAANRPSNPYGIDFLIFNSAGFVIVNGDYSGGGITDGSLFGGGNSLTEVSVSYDGINYFTLDPALAPPVRSLFPTDGTGDFTRPVDPTLTAHDFNGLDLSEIRLRYDSSAGGTPYDLDWARDGEGNAVLLDEINFVRVRVLEGRLEIDGFSAVQAVPEPSTWLLLLAGGLITTVSTLQRRRAKSQMEAAKIQPLQSVPVEHD
jgi:hypothetical protein